MARGIYHATMINTVSPTYAREILTPAAAPAWTRLLRYRHFDVHGILNGLDYDVWDPAADTHLASTLRRRHARAARGEQARAAGAAGRSTPRDVPLVAMVTRLDRAEGPRHHRPCRCTCC